MKELLLLRTDSLGDNIIFSSILPHIRKKFRKWKITLACKKNLISLYDFCPFLDEVVDIKGDYKKDYDLAVNGLYSRTLLSDSLTLNSGAKKTVAFRGYFENIPADKISLWHENNKKYSELIHVPLPHNCPEINKYYYLLKALDIRAERLKPLVWIEPSLCEDKSCIVIFCGGAWPYKYVFNLGKALDDFIDDNTEIIALGGLYEWAVNQENLDSIKRGNKVNLCGETSIHDALKIINNSRLVIGVDTGLGHGACALDKDNIILVGGGHPGRFFPYHPKTLLVRKELDCYGCNWRCTADKKVDCMNIPVEKIKKTIALRLKPAKKKPLKKRRYRGVLLTVIVWVYKRERFIEGLLENLFLQTLWQNMEVILVNCNSPENEETIIKKYTSRYENLRYIKLDYNPGIYRAWNLVIKKAEGKYITNSYAADRYREDAFEILVHTLEVNPRKALAYAGFYVTEKENDTFGHNYSFWKPQKFDYEFLHKRCYIGPSPVWRRSVHDKYGYFDEELLYTGDWEFWLRIADEGFIEVNKILSLHYSGRDGEGPSNKDIIHKERDMVYNKYKNRLFFSRFYIPEVLFD